MPDRQQSCYWVDLSNDPDNESNHFNCLLQSLDYQILQSESRQSCNSVDLFDQIVVAGYFLNKRWNKIG